MFHNGIQLSGPINKEWKNTLYELHKKLGLHSSLQRKEPIIDLDCRSFELKLKLDQLSRNVDKLRVQVIPLYFKNNFQFEELYQC